MKEEPPGLPISLEINPGHKPVIHQERQDILAMPTLGSWRVDFAPVAQAE
jgi:hypothetical protein